MWRTAVPPAPGPLQIDIAFCARCTGTTDNRSESTQTLPSLERIMPRSQTLHLFPTIWHRGSFLWPRASFALFLLLILADHFGKLRNDSGPVKLVHRVTQ